MAGFVYDDKFMKAAEKYLHLKGAKIIGTEWRFIVFQDLDDDSLVFAYIADEDGYGSINRADLRHAFEHAAASFLRENDIEFEGNLRCDLIEFDVISNDRAILRQTISAIN